MYRKTIYVIELLSRDDIISCQDMMSLGVEEIFYQMRDGDCSGVIKSTESRTVSEKEMEDLLIQQGSDPRFLIYNDY